MEDDPHDPWEEQANGSPAEPERPANAPEAPGVTERLAELQRSLDDLKLEMDMGFSKLVGCILGAKEKKATRAKAKPKTKRPAKRR